MSKETYFYQALAQVVGAKPPEKYKTLTVKEYLDKDDDGLQDWAIDKVTLEWSTGIGCIDAAMILLEAQKGTLSALKADRKALARHTGLWVESLKPCPCCPDCDPELDLTEPHDVGMGIDYVVCQLCGLRADREGWNSIPRLPTKKESESVVRLSYLLAEARQALVESSKFLMRNSEVRLGPLMETNEALILMIGDLSE